MEKQYTMFRCGGGRTEAGCYVTMKVGRTWARSSINLVRICSAAPIAVTALQLEVNFVSADAQYLDLV